MKRILGLDLGTNSIGWALIKQDFNKKEGKIVGMGSRIIPMDQKLLSDFKSGNTVSQTADRTHYRGMRRLNQRYKLRRDRLHRVLHELGFLPKHYENAIDFERKLGQFKPNYEVKLNYKKDSSGKHRFIFLDSFNEMQKEFKDRNVNQQIPYDWTLYYLQQKALSKPITKEELAWVILSFNQKRGYYQLRGEEAKEMKDKSKEYKVLKVDKLIDSGDKVDGNTLYDVVFKNGWKYDRQITKTEDWEGKKREFIVTSKPKKDGSIKRTYKKVDSEKDWIAIKKKTEQNIEKTEKTVGQYIYNSLIENPKQKIKGSLIKTIDRKFYRDELEQILEKQREFHKELKNNDLYKTCLKELYPRNEAHYNNNKDKNFTYLFLDDIIFYQRPLKSKKSLISNCPYEKRYYKEKEEIKEAPVKCIPKSNPIYQEFRLWQFLHNLKIYKKIGESNKNNEDVTQELLGNEDEWCDLFDFLNNKKEISQKQLLNYFSKKKKIPKQPKEDPDYTWNYVEDKKYPCNETKAAFIKRLKKVKGVKPKKFLTPKTEKKLWHLIYSVTDKKQFDKALKTFANKEDIEAESFFNAFETTPPYDKDYGAYSEKAIKKLLPLMRMGNYWKEDEISDEVKGRVENIMERLKSIDFNKEELESVADDDVPIADLRSFQKLKNKNPLKGLNTYQACYAVYQRHSEVVKITNWTNPKDIENYLDNVFEQHQLRNPIVEQVVTETLRVVQDIWEEYGNGEKDFFNEIHLELGRDMKNSKEKRDRLSKRNSARERENERIKAILQELQNEGIQDVKPYSPNQQEILKIYARGVSNNAHYKNVPEKEIEKIKRKNSPTQKEILRYKLWLEQGYVSPYTGNIIKMSDLFTTKYQIEHIIPQSRYFDNSFNNKVICESEINPYPYKDNQTAYEFIKNQGGTKVNEKITLLKLEEYEQHCKRYFRKNQEKLKNLLSEDVPQQPTTRQLNDTRYISKFIKGVLSNILRKQNEREAIAKNLVPMSGSITAKLRQQWGLNDKWNEIIAPRFKRMNEITDSKDYGYWDNKINAFRNQVPTEIAQGFSKKRIDHRHHALDALIIACTTKDHINYITSLNTARKNYKLVSKIREVENIQLSDKKTGKKIERRVAKSYKKPWKGFVQEAKNNLEKIIASFKQNTRVINRTNNRTWHWERVNGHWKKKLQTQKGKNFAIRKQLHKETYAGKVKMETKKGKIATASRVPLSDIKNNKHIEKIRDKGIQRILMNHLKNYIDNDGEKDFKAAFNQTGITELNKNIVKLNYGKPHQPIYKVKQFEIGTKFSVGETGNKKDKYVEAAKGTNLYFVIYWDAESEKRVFETIPLNEVIEHQKQTIHLSMKDKLPIPIDRTKGEFLFYLSPNDLVYVPDEEEMDINEIAKPTKLQRIYKMVSSSGTQCFFIPHNVSEVIKNKIEFSSLNKMEKDINGIMIKKCCYKLKINRLGQVENIIRG